MVQREVARCGDDQRATGELEFLAVMTFSLEDAGRLCLCENAGYADAAKRLCGYCQNAVPLLRVGLGQVRARTLLMPHQGLGRQFAEQIAIPACKPTHVRDVPAMGHPGDRASSFGVRDKFMTNAMQAELKNV